MPGGRSWWRKAAILLALCAGSVGASTPPAPPNAAAWKADPDEQFILDVTIRQLRLGDGVRAYAAPQGTCVVLGDFTTTLDVPVKVDLGAHRATGWAFKEGNRIDIDLAARTARYGARSEDIAPGTIYETPEGWCVQTSALSRWFGISVKPVTGGSVLVLDSTEKLPVELAMERQARAAQLSKAAKFDIKELPRVRIPYRMWRAPALDFVVSAGITYRAKDGLRADRQASVFAAGEIARLSYDAQVSTDQRGLPTDVRFRAYRSDPDGNLLGFAHATHYSVGDVEGYDSRLTATGGLGRGAVITNRPLTAQTAFDRTRFEGDLPAGWEAELYRNDELVAFVRADPSQRYRFEDVQLLYGENRIRIVLYGPQGQTRTREEIVNVGQDNAPPGTTWYWAGVSQPGRDLVNVEKPPDRAFVPKAQATVAVEHGLDQRTSVAAIARAMLIDDQRVTFVEGSVRRSIGPALGEVSAARDSRGGMAARAQLIGNFGGVNVNAEAVVATNFHLQNGPSQSVKDVRLAVDAPLKIGRTLLPAHADVHLKQLDDGTRRLDAATRLAATFGRFNLATAMQLSKQFSPTGSKIPADAHVSFIGSGFVHRVRVRGSTTFDVAPTARFREADLEAYWSASERVNWQAGVAYDALEHRARASISHIRRLNTMAIAVTAEAATDGSVALGFNLNFSLDPRHGINFSREPLAQAGEVRALVYRDYNGNGVRDADEPAEKGALITTGARASERATGKDGSLLVGGLTAFKPIAVGLDLTSLSDPMLVPQKPLQVVVPRPGVPAEVQIALVGGGDVEGALVKSGGAAFEGVDLELVNGEGKVAATARTDFDGFFLFERIAYGHYCIRVAAASATAAKIAADLGVQFSIDPNKSIVRLGSIRAGQPPLIAQAGSAAQPLK